MKIIHLIPRFPFFGGETVIGGAASSLFNLAKEQARIHEVAVLGHLPEGASYPDWGSKIKFVPLSVLSSPSSLRFGMEYAFRAAKEVSRFGSPKSLIHGHSGYLDYVLATILASERSGGVPSVHTVYCPVNPKSRRAFLLKQLASERWSRYPSVYIAISDNVAMSLQGIGVSPMRIRVIRPAVNIRRFTQASNSLEIRNRLGIPPTSSVVLFVGSTKPEKNLDTVLEAIPLIAKKGFDCLLLVTTELAHPQHQERAAFLARRISELGLTRQVRQVGIANNMADLMASCDILLAPFLHTYGPSDYFIAALEAMCAGKPVVASSVGGMPEVINDNNGRLVTDPTDREEVAAAVVELLSSKALRDQLGASAHQMVQSMFAPELIADQVEAVYRSIL